MQIPRLFDLPSSEEPVLLRDLTDIPVSEVSFSPSGAKALERTGMTEARHPESGE